MMTPAGVSIQKHQLHSIMVDQIVYVSACGVMSQCKLVGSLSTNATDSDEYVKTKRTGVTVTCYDDKCTDGRWENPDCPLQLRLLPASGQAWT